MCYVGDCYDDIDLLEQSKISFTPNNALHEIKSKAKIVTNRCGGEGCILEIVFTLKNLGLL